MPRRQRTNNTRSAVIVLTLGGLACSQTLADDRIWNAAEGGDFEDPANWDDGESGIPGVEDTAIFNLDAAYEVLIATDQATDRVVVQRGVVTILTDGLESYTLLNAIPGSPSILVGNDDVAELVLTADISLRGRFTTLGMLPGGHGTLTADGPAVELRNADHLVLGYEGAGTLLALNGATVNCRLGALALLPAGLGDATIRGAGTSWNCEDRLTIGAQGTASMLIDETANVTCNDGIVAQQLGSFATVAISGAGSAWVVSGPIDVGQRGLGSMLIDDGGRVVNLTFATIGTLPDNIPGEGGIGIVTVQGAASSWLVFGDLYVGFLSHGTLVLSEGGRVEVDGDLLTAVGPGSTRMFIELGAADDYNVAPALFAGGISEGFAPEVMLLDGYEPALGDRFEIVHAVGGVASYDFDLPELPDELGWSVIETFDHIALAVVQGCSAADLDGSGAVDFGDILVILTDWGPCPKECPADLDASGAVDFGDILVVLTAWGPCP